VITAVAEQERRVADRQKSKGLRGNAEWLLVAALIGLSVLAIYSISQPSEPFTSPFSVGAMASIAALVLGGLLGFLFGIPRYLQGSQEVTSDTTGGPSDQGIPYRDNTNLEEISDWLTKILIGVGLVEISQAGGSVGRLVTNIGEGMGGGPSSRIVAGATLIYFSTIGFLGGYLSTRMVLTSALARAAREAQEAYERIGTYNSDLRYEEEVTMSVAGEEDLARALELTEVVRERLRHFENLAMGMMADALCGTHTLKPRVSIGGESVDCVLEGIRSEWDYLFEVQYHIDRLDLDPILKAVQGLGKAVASASTAGREAIGLVLVVLGNWSQDEIDPIAERTRIHEMVQSLSGIRENVSAHVRITVFTEDRLERMIPQELRIRLLTYPHVVTPLARVTG
jgi:hypothetical protein